MPAIILDGYSFFDPFFVKLVIYYEDNIFE